MSATDFSTTNNQHVPFAGPLAIPQAPPDIPASVTIALADGQVVAGVPVTITVQTDPGTHFVRNTHDQSFDEEPAVTYTGEIRVSGDGVPGGRWGVRDLPAAR